MILLYSSISSLRTADVFPVIASLPQRSGDRKYVCGSQANLSPAGKKNLNKCSIDISFLEKRIYLHSGLITTAELSTLPNNQGDSRFWTVSLGLQIRV